MTLWDWVAVGVYLSLVIAIGVAAHRRRDSERGFVQANRSMPFWAVGLSMLATALGADDFIGEPQFAFARDLALLGAFAVGYVGVIIVATLFLPRFYRSNALTIYGYLGERFGPGARVAASAVASIGGVVAAGVGLFVATFAVTPLFGAATDPAVLRERVIMTLLVVGLVGTLYTTIGGIRSVIWTDVAQMVVVFIGGGYAIWYLLDAIPLSPGEMIARWTDAPVPAGEPGATGNKLRLFRTGGGVGDPYSPWSLPLWAVFFVGIFGTSHGFTQRLLTCQSARHAGVGMLFGYTVGMLSAVMFLLIGLLIYLFNDPTVMGPTATSAGAFAASEEIYPRLVVEYFPAGLLGLSLAAMLAAVMSSFDSATAAISSTFVADVLRPLRHGFRVLAAPNLVIDENARPPLRATALTGLVLTASGVAAALLYDPEDSLLVDFALGISSFPLGGMIGVFCTALFTRRGNSRSVVAALIVGPLVWLFVQPELLDLVTVPLLGQSITLATLTEEWFAVPLTFAWPWWFSIAAGVSFAVCCSGRPPRR